jgi:hypothetical protein
MLTMRKRACSVSLLALLALLATPVPSSLWLAR